MSGDNPEDCIDVPLDCIHIDGDHAVHLEEFTLQLRVMTFWLLDEIPVGVLDFCSCNDVEIWRESVINLPGSEDTDLLSSLLTAYSVPGEIPFEEIIGTGRWELVLHALSRMSKDSVVSAVAAGMGALAVLKYLHEEGFLWHEDTCAEAAIGGHLECLKYAHEHGCPWDIKTHVYAAQSGSLLCMKYAHEQELEWHPDACAYAALGGSLECLTYAHENGCPWNCNTVRNAAQKGHFPCLHYALEQGCAFDAEACYMAAKNGHQPCLQLLLEYGAPWSVMTSVYSAMCSDVACLRFLHENDCPWDEDTVVKAATAGVASTLRYALEEGCPHYEYTMEAAAISCSLECLEYLIDVQLLITNEEVFQVALLRGDFACVRFLLDRDCQFRNTKFGNDPAQIELFDEYFRADNPDFVKCVEYVVDRGWTPYENFISCVIIRDPLCRLWLIHEGWLVDD